MILKVKNKRKAKGISSRKWTRILARDLPEQVSLTGSFMKGDSLVYRDILYRDRLNKQQEAGMFIGRDDELMILEQKYQSPKSELVVLFGRRRIGKTETLRQFCKGKEHIFYSCIQDNNETQRRLFSKAVLEQNHPLAGFIQSFDDWETALKAAAVLPYKGKKLVVMDEFPYLVKGDPSFPSILQNVWDRELKDQKVMLILCGSSMSFIEKEFLAHKNPMYGRATAIMKMKSLPFRDVCRFFPNYSPREQVLVYSILGGIPHYLIQFNPDKSLAENVKEQILNPGTLFASETEFLLKEELREPAAYNSIIKAVAAGASRLGEIKDRALLGSTGLTSTYLSNLTDLGIIKKVFSIDAGEKVKSNRQRGIYKVADHYFDFWYSFCHTNRSSIDGGMGDALYDQVIEPSMNHFASSAFEEICTEYLWKLNQMGELPFTFFDIGHWMGKTTVRDPGYSSGLRTEETELDIMAFSQDRNQVLVGECKFKNAPFQFSEYLDTAAKAEKLERSAAVHYYLFSLAGFDEKLVEHAAMNSRIHLIPLSEIVPKNSPCGSETKIL